MKTLIFWVACLAPLVTAGAQFQNLGFDDPAVPLPSMPFELGPAEWFVPGWADRSFSAVGYNYSQNFAGRSSLLDKDYSNTSQPANPTKVPVVGNFSLGIWPPSIPVTGGLLEPYILRQTGDVPADAKSLRFLYEGDNLRVSLGGVALALFPAGIVTSGDPNVPLFAYWAADVSAFAGKTAELKFEFRSFGNYPFLDGGQVPGWPDAKMHVLDDLSFSPQSAVPEPSTWALMGLGAAALAWPRRRDV